MEPKQMVKVLYQGKMVETYSDISVMEGVVVIDNGNIAEATEIVGSASSDVTALEELIARRKSGEIVEICSDISMMQGVVIESEWDSELTVVHPEIITLQSIMQAIRNFLTTLGGKFKWTS